MSTVFAWGVDRSETGFDGGDHKVIDLKAMAAEFIVMTLFVIIGCGTACKIPELSFFLCNLLLWPHTGGLSFPIPLPVNWMFFFVILLGLPRLHLLDLCECRQAAMEPSMELHVCWLQ
jgi:hypothetical protein